MKPSKCSTKDQAKEKKGEKRGMKGKEKSKSQDCCVTFKPLKLDFST